MDVLKKVGDVGIDRYWVVEDHCGLRSDLGVLMMEDEHKRWTSGDFVSSLAFSPMVNDSGEEDGKTSPSLEDADN